MLQINKNYYGYSSKQELIEKITAYLNEATEWDYENDCWVYEGQPSWPNWTFSGLPNGDKLTSFVKENALLDISFSNEEDRINECKKQAIEIAEEIELVSI